ncbi:putative ETO1-like protein 1-like [Trypanosoma theileri]|uniref:Putative ETO1-like protein 1-like n=1 Tax=Trypanosoma theileri TaxID=67003 RepID=A0A1X0NZI4_9TRYP|nr:putative ETO1-like protein 1-like [Trypanosoma theileri]ORC90104.1 putative ETO1-like protein 1-like [Trypanosoma theileri]
MGFAFKEVVASTQESTIKTPNPLTSLYAEEKNRNGSRTNTKRLNSSTEQLPSSCESTSLNQFPRQLVGVLWNQLFPSLIAPFLLPRDVAQVALVSRTLYHVTQRPETWKHMAVVFFDITPDAAESLEELFWKLYRTEMSFRESGCNKSNSLGESRVQTVSVRRTESPSKLSFTNEKIWMLEGKAIHTTPCTPFSRSDTYTTVERHWDYQEVSALEEEKEEEGQEEEMLSLQELYQEHEQQFEKPDGFLLPNFCPVDSHLVDSFVVRNDISQLQGSINNIEDSIVLCNDIQRANEWSTHDSPLPIQPQSLPHHYERHDVEELSYNSADEICRNSPLRHCEGCSPLIQLSRRHFLDVNTNDSLLLEALHCWTSVEVEALMGSESDLKYEELLVCAATMNRTAQQSHEPFPWKAYYKTLYERRVGSFLRSLRCMRDLSQRALSLGDVHAAVEHLTSAVNTIYQGGCSMSGRGTGTVVCMELCRTLRLRAHLYHRLGEMESAYSDFCLANLLDHNNNSINNNKIGDENEVTLFPFTPEMVPNGDFNCLSSCLEFEYSQMSVQKDVFHRAAFLQRWLHHHGASVFLYLQQYMICDDLKIGAPHLLQRAAECATTYEHVLVQAWKSYDRGQTESAVSEAELAVSMLPLSFRLHAEQVSAALQPLLADPVEEELLRFFRTNPESQSQSQWQLPSQHQSQSPTAAFAYYTLGFMAQTVPGVGSAALLSFLALSHSDTHRAVALRLLAHDHAERGNTGSAVSLLRIALQLSPNTYSLYSHLARQQMLAGDKLAAYTTLSRAIEKCRPIPAEAFAERSRCRLLDPLLDVNEATCRDPRMSYPYQIRAAMKMDQGDSEAAITEISRIISLTSNPNDILLRSCFRLDSGRQEGVLEDLVMLVLLAPQQESYREWLLRSAEFFSGSESNNDTNVNILTRGSNSNEYSSDEVKGAVRRNAAGLKALLSALGL